MKKRFYFRDAVTNIDHPQFISTMLHVAAAFLVPGLDGEPMARILAKARELGLTTSLDTAWDAEGRWMELVGPCLNHVDIFTPSIEEGQMLTGKQEPYEITQEALEYGIMTTRKLSSS